MKKIWIVWEIWLFWMWHTQLFVQSTSKFSSQPSKACPLQVLLMGCSQGGHVKYIAKNIPADVSDYTITVLLQMIFYCRMVTRVSSCTKTHSPKFHDPFIPDSDTPGPISENVYAHTCISAPLHSTMFRWCIKSVPFAAVHNFSSQFFLSIGDQLHYIILYYISTSILVLHVTSFTLKNTLRCCYKVKVKLAWQTLVTVIVFFIISPHISLAPT